MSALRLYLTNAAAGYTPPTVRGSWATVAYAVTKALSASKATGTPGQSTAGWSWIGGNQAVLHYRGVSDALAAGDLPAAGYVSLRIPVVADYGPTPSRFRLHVYLTVGDSDTVRATIVNQYLDAANNWPTTKAGWSLDPADVAYSGLSYSAGDRLVAEVGEYTSGGYGSVNLTYGTQDGGGTPLADTSLGSASTTAPWVQVSSDQTPASPGRATQVGADVASVSTPPARMTQVGADVAWQLPVVGRFTQVGMDVAYTGPYAPVNESPVVDAGADQFIPIGSPTVTLAGSATDDGQPDPPAALTYLWTKQSGPGTVTFADDTDPGTNATFSQPGVYVLRLTADDSALTGYDEMTVTVVLPAPVISALTPDVGSVDGGTPVTIDGSGFLAGATVTFDGESATDVVVVSGTQITCVTPAHAAGFVDVVVTNADAQFDTLVDGYQFLIAPTITSVLPTFGPSAGGTAVVITGTGFASGAVVSFGGPLGHSLVVVSDTEITCVTPAHAAGRVDVTVTNTDGGFGTRINAFTYYNSGVLILIDTGSGFEDWTSYASLADKPRIELVLNGRSTASFVLTRDRPSIPPRYSRVMIYDTATGEPLFGGIIDDRELQPYEDTIDDDYVTCQCSDYGLIWDSCIVSLAYTGTITPEDVLDDLVTKYLSPRYDVAYAKVATGFTLQGCSWVNASASSVIRDLNTKCGVNCYITPNNEIVAFATGTLRVPYSITDSDPHSKKVTWKDGDQTPANTVIVTLNKPVLAAEMFDTPGTTDGDYVYFQTAYPCSQNSSDVWPSAVVIDGTAVVGVLFGFPTATYPWGWDYTTHRLVCDTRYATPPAAGHVVTITYSIAAVIVTTGETPELDALVSADAETLDAGEYAVEKLRVLDQMVRVITIISLESGWLPGQTGNITRTSRDLIDVPYLISNVIMELEEGLWTRTITGLENSLYQGSYIDQWKTITGSGGGSTPTPTPVIPPVTPEEPPAAPITHSISSNILTAANVADLGPYVSTGRQITVTFGFGFTGNTRFAPGPTTAYDATTKQNPGARLLLQRSVGGGAFATVATITVANGTHTEEPPNSSDSGFYIQLMSATGTYVDPDLSTDTREYKLLFDPTYGTSGWLNVNSVVSPAGYSRKNTLSIQTVEQ